jgi:hypothetical protein
LGITDVGEDGGGDDDDDDDTYIHTFHKTMCVIKTVGCGTSHKYTNIPVYSVKHYTVFFCGAATQHGS